MGGSDKLTEQRALDPVQDVDPEKLAAYTRRMNEHIAAIKKHLEQFIEKTTHLADGSRVTAALLDLGFERQLDLHGEEDAKDLIDHAFRRVVKERRGPLQ